MRRIPGSLFVLCLLVTAIAARAEEAPSFTLGEALRNSRLIADFRLRFEQVDDDAFTRPAAATRCAARWVSRPANSGAGRCGSSWRT